MNKKSVIAVVVLLAGVIGWCLHHYSDREVIKRTLGSMAVALGKEGEESPIQLALKMRPVKDFIAPACKVNVPESNYHEILDPDLVIRYLIVYRSRQANLLVTIDGIEVDIPGKGSAEVSILIHMTANQNQPDFFDEIHQVKFSLQKEEKKWRLHQATLPDALVHGH
jgi:hypothetical protein